MTPEERKVKKDIASTLLAGMLANPHIYSLVSEDEGIGQQEKILLSKAIAMAEKLVDQVEHPHGSRR
ncbi:MAG: hypothetical protein AAF215_12860 [Cyanobacteria bacterium P01_A01_bin.123]